MPRHARFPESPVFESQRDSASKPGVGTTPGMTHRCFDKPEGLVEAWAYHATIVVPHLPAHCFLNEESRTVSHRSGIAKVPSCIRRCDNEALLECTPVEIGGVEDHVHILSLFPRTRTVAEVVKETKRVSTNWLLEQAEELRGFHWQAGYGVFSVSQSNVDGVVDYIRRQEEHHRKQTFQDEYRAFLKKHAVEFDERYVWD